MMDPALNIEYPPAPGLLLSPPARNRTAVVVSARTELHAAASGIAAAINQTEGDRLPFVVSSTCLSRR